MSTVVDLTLNSDSDEDRPARKRQRVEHGRARAPVSQSDSDVELVDSSDVEIIRPPPRAQAAPQANDADIGEADLIITAASVQVATRDLPHSRPDCAEYPFTSGTAASNARCCPQCYCYVCDSKATECRFWGTGARERDHSNARPLGYWRRLREAARAGNRGLIHAEYHGTGPLGAPLPQRPQPQQTRIPFPLAGSGRTPGGASAAGSGSGPQESAPGASGHGVQHNGAGPAAVPQPPVGTAAGASGPGASAGTGRVQVPPVAASAPAQTTGVDGTKVQTSIVKLPTGKCTMRRLPDPATERNAFELGTLRFAVKATRGLTVSTLAERLEPSGFYYESSKKAESSGDRFTLETLFESKPVCKNGNYKSKALYCKLLPLPSSHEMTQPSTERVRKVLVIDCLGRTPATYMGVGVREKTKRADVLAALAPILRPAFSAAAELLHLVSTPDLDQESFRIVDAETTLDDSWFSQYPCNNFRQAGHVLVFRTAHHPAPTWSVDAEVAAAQGTAPGARMPTYLHVNANGASSSSSANVTPSWLLIYVRQQSDPRAAGVAQVANSTSASHLTAPLLVPLRRDHAVGGRDAEKELVTALNLGLQAYRTSAPLSSAHSRPVIVLRGNRWFYDDRQRNSAWGVPGQNIGMFAQTKLLQAVTAVMPQGLSSSSYHLTAMGSPAVDPTATAAALRESQEAIRRSKEREAALSKRKQLPVNCINELVQASRRALLSDIVAIQNMPACSVGLRATLRPSSCPGASSRDGELVIQVYVWSADSPGVKSLFKPWDDWPSIMGKREHASFPLKNTAMLLATGATDVPRAAATAGTSAAGPLTSAAACVSAAAPSTSAASRPEGLAALSVAQQQRVRAERRRAQRMFDSVQELSELRQIWSINKVLEYMQSGERPSAEQPTGLTVAMRPYQLQSLGFMVELERLVDAPGANGLEGAASDAAASASGEPDESLSDIDGPGGYRRLFWAPVTNSRGQRYWYSPVLERLSFDVPAQPIGGFLAEEMGLGKTVEVMAITLANPPAPWVVAGTKLPCGHIQSRATLVVCAVSLVGQWQAEAQNKAKGSCRIHPYHGPNRIRDPQRLATEFDVVVTTYQTLQSDHAAGKLPCHAIKWHRIVFDEGHMLKSAGAKMSKAANELAADRKWVCTGTPINNAVDDLMGQFAALHMMPFGKKTFFDSYVKMPFLGARCGLNMIPLLYTIRHSMIRHTKAQNLGGQEVLQLPDKIETDIPVLLSAEEQALYQKVHKEAQRGWQKLKSAGPRVVNSHLFSATSMLMPMRRICSGGLLKPADLTVPDPERLSALGGTGGTGTAGSGAADAQEVPVPDDIADCPICVDTLEQPVVTPCNHWFCRECLTGWINASAHHNCPACRQSVSVQQLRRGVRQQALPALDEATAAEASDDGMVACESKVQTLLDQLRKMREEDPTAKALVFTQFSQALDWLKPRLIEEGFGHRTITGDMTQKKRGEAVDAFQRDPSTTVFLLSVRSGAVGINLTAANHVFLLEPCMNPATEEQAIGRAWRMGQQRAVVVKRLYVKGSVEERIMEVVKARRAASGGAAGGDSAAGAGPSAGSRAGALRQDKTDLRISELDLMFRDPEFPSTQPAAGR